MMRLKNISATAAVKPPTTLSRQWGLSAKRGAASAVGAGVLAAAFVVGGSGPAAAVTPGVAKLCNQSSATAGYRTWIELTPSGRSSFTTSPGQCATINIYGDDSANFWMIDQRGGWRMLRHAAWSSPNAGIDAYAYGTVSQPSMEYYKN
ncbi:hypothetical protein [Streptomyces sp. WAC 04229]|uniref:hypothetical protein n=1 Tax=Streptomyces sp. WAC 04229 TaxID=2203206 RepID=UPI003D748F81